MRIADRPGDAEISTGLRSLATFLTIGPRRMLQRREASYSLSATRALAAVPPLQLDGRRAASTALTKPEAWDLVAAFSTEQGR